jgi:hypothetical protein
MSKYELINISKQFEEAGIPHDSVQEELGLIMSEYTKLKDAGIPENEIDSKLEEFMDTEKYRVTSIVASRRRRFWAL